MYKYMSNIKIHWCPEPVEQLHYALAETHKVATTS